MDIAMTVKRRDRWVAGTVLGLALLLCPRSLKAQYEDRPTDESPAARYLAAGVDARLFEPGAANTAPDSLSVRFRGAMPMLSFHQGLVDLYFGYAPYTLRGRSRSTVVFGTTVANEFSLTGRGSSALILPLMLAADFTKAESAGIQADDFNVGSIGIGGGLKYRLVRPDLEFSAQVLELFHFSFEGLGVGTGFSPATIANASLLLRDFLVADGVVIGYRFRLQTWSMSDRFFRYRAVSHGPFVGVMF